MSDTLKEIIGFTLLVIALAFSFIVSAKIGYTNLFPKEENIQSEEVVTLKTIQCADGQYEEDGVCKNTMYICPKGEKVADKSFCPQEVVVTSSTSVVTPATSSVSIKKATTSVLAVEEKMPIIKNVTITPKSGGVVVSISGNNFDKKVNTVLLTSQGELVKKMTFPAYSGSNNMQVINFQMNDFREHYANKYSFQVSVKDKDSNVFGVNE